MHLKKLLFQFVVCITTNSLMGNNVQVSNISLQNRNTVAKTNMIHFDVSWENSWRTSTLESNWDAVWVFAKYRVKGQQNWKHATLDTIGHTGPSTCKIDSVTGGKGVFIKSNTDLTLSNVNYQNIELKWLYGTDGLQDNDSVEICVFAIEMVYVPQGAFYAGDATSTYSIGVSNSTNASPVYVNSPTFSGSFYGIGTGGAAITLNNKYPNGYNGFYCMKYEVTQGQYTDFLNKLTAVEAGARYFSSSVSRYTISGTHPNFIASAPHRACNYISLNDAEGYAGWSGLRLMSELEYEKACRGPLNSVPNEFAWGNSTYTSATSVANDGALDEAASNSAANVNFNNIVGPVRVGFAQGTTRETTGSSYYGIKDMSGNVWEIVKSILAYNMLDKNVHGTGSVVGAYSNTTYYDVRGGSHSGNVYGISYRGYNTISSLDGRYSHFGFRCVRTY